MFMQIMHAPCKDPEGARRLMDRWVEELGPAAAGWLGTTAGVTADQQLFAAARFASVEEARANSDRREQGEWWTELTQLADGEVTVSDCHAVELWLGGGSDDAGFVQVMQFTIIDRDAARRVMTALSKMTSDDIGRTDVIGSTIAWHDDGDAVSQVVYFTSEAEAREGEARGGEDADERMTDMAEAFAEPRYLDITEPWLYSPR